MKSFLIIVVILIIGFVCWLFGIGYYKIEQDNWFGVQADKSVTVDVRYTIWHNMSIIHTHMIRNIPANRLDSLMEAEKKEVEIIKKIQ